jgi:hypothetical protein
MDDMTLPEIFVALPSHVAELLEKLLEGSVLPQDPTHEEIEAAGRLLISYIKDAMPNESHGTYALLDKIPRAVVEQLQEV